MPGPGLLRTKQKNRPFGPDKRRSAFIEECPRPIGPLSIAAFGKATDTCRMRSTGQRPPVPAACPPFGERPRWLTKEPATDAELARYRLLVADGDVDAVGCHAGASGHRAARLARRLRDDHGGRVGGEVARPTSRHRRRRGAMARVRLPTVDPLKCQYPPGDPRAVRPGEAARRSCRSAPPRRRLVRGFPVHRCGRPHGKG